MKKMNKKGFTIVELVIVIAVIAILAAVMIPTFSGVVDKANSAKVLQQARNLYTEYYTLDLSDGVVNGEADSSSIPFDSNASYIPGTDGKVTFEYEVGGWKAIYNGTTWSTTEVE